MIIGIPVYDDVDMLDVTGPFEMFEWAGFEIDLLAEQKGMKKFRNGFRFEVTKSFADARAYDAIWVPGGDPKALATIIDDSRQTYIHFLIAQAARTRMVCSVCEGALLLAAAGLLDQYYATTHWAVHSMLRRALPKSPGRRRTSPLRARPQSPDRRRDFVGPRRSPDADPVAGGDGGRAAGPATDAILSGSSGQQCDPAGATKLPGASM